jgi:predicted nuclease of restriction endonuclease-like (RecB) superfamily
MADRPVILVVDDDKNTRAGLFDRVATIIEQARGHVVRAVNTSMVLAYWCIGREIVRELQGGEERAAYGKQVLETLSAQLTARFGKGFSATNLEYFRKFYRIYAARMNIPHAVCEESEPSEKPSLTDRKRAGVTAQAQSRNGDAPDWFPQLSWSHYRVLMRVDDEKARFFYEKEAVACGWSTAQLERQIHSFYYQRHIVHSSGGECPAKKRKRLQGETTPAEKILKSPFVLEFLGLPDAVRLRESDLEQAIIDNLQAFLLELGKGFSFVARQKHVHIDNEDYFIDLVFYNFLLRNTFRFCPPKKNSAWKSRKNAN